MDVRQDAFLAAARSALAFRDDAAGREDVEGPCTLADEVRCGLETRAPANASAREERDDLGAEEPRGGLGGVSGVGVLRQDDDEAPPEAKMERGDHDRQGRFGDSRPRALPVRRLDREALVHGGELVGEGLQALAVHELSGDDL
jgi:hypothetical protein